MSTTDEHGARQWSTRALTVITAAGTLIGGIGTFLGVFYGGTRQSGGDPRPVVTVTATVTTTATGATSGTPASGTTPAPAGVRWRGSILITDNDTDLDLVPADNDVESGGDVNGNGYLSVTGASLRWTATADPSRQECASRLRTHAETDADYEDPTPGMRVCLRTDGGRIALLNVKKSAPFAYEVTATVWKGPDG